MRVPSAARAVSMMTVGALVATVFVSEVSSSVPGNPTYGIKEAVVELQTALASDGRERSGRYLDKVDLDIAELDLLAKQGASREKVEAVTRRAVTTERHAQAELSDRAPEPETAGRYQAHHRKLTDTLKRTKQPAVRDSLRELLRILPQDELHERQ